MEKEVIVMVGIFIDGELLKQRCITADYFLEKGDEVNVEYRAKLEYGRIIEVDPIRDFTIHI